MKTQMENMRNNEDITTKRNYVRSSVEISELSGIPQKIRDEEND